MTETELETNEETETETETEPEEDEEGEPEEDEEGEPEPVAAEADPDEVQRLLAIEKALERENKRHEKSLSTLYAEQWEHYVMCPLCIGEGFLRPWPVGELPGEQLDAMDVLSGRFTPPEYVEDADYQRCDHCDGWGKTITGAQDPGHLTKLCDKCSGNGFKARSPSFVVVPPTPLPGAPDAMNAQPAVNYGASGPADAWGRPAGHVHYGIEPQFVTA